MIKLGVNIDHIATLRQQRREDFPNLCKAAQVCCDAGADGITMHLREDRRHIQDKDVFDIRQNIKTKLNLEMAASAEIVEITLKVRPDSVCLVPEKRQELTTEGGLDVSGQREKLAEAVGRLKSAGICVSMFIEPNILQVEACAQIKADCIEIHTGKYAKLFSKLGGADEKIQAALHLEIGQIKAAAEAAKQEGLIVNAGHGLDYENIPTILKVSHFNEFNIGFS
ncbi:MAG: pyridoxine 5'-phosphate synthase, partial [Elusimicrobiota bacterium]|nr:pyridoxine 5'-phosphate synthase [Elusimicrobiota bacterium]